MERDDANPMHRLAAARAATRCTAKAKRTGFPCGAPAVRGWAVCRMHGAGGGHPPGKAHPRWKHGMRSREWTEQRREICDLVREARELDALIR